MGIFYFFSIFWEFFLVILVKKWEGKVGGKSKVELTPYFCWEGESE